MLQVKNNGKYGFYISDGTSNYLGLDGLMYPQMESYNGETNSGKYFRTEFEAKQHLNNCENTKNTYKVAVFYRNSLLVIINVPIKIKHTSSVLDWYAKKFILDRSLLTACFCDSVDYEE